MFTLPLTDPLWRKLDDAHRTRDIADMLQSLINDWDPQLAEELFWDHLCHQDTCYGATYAAVPHLLALAKSTSDETVRRSLAEFLGHVSLVAMAVDEFNDGNTPQGLPDTLEGWDRKLDVYRELQTYEKKTAADASLPQDIRNYAQKRLALMTDILERPNVDSEDLARINQIRETFFAVQGDIAEICARAQQSVAPQERHRILEGVAAALGDLRLAALFSQGRDGTFECANCQTGYSYLMFGERMAFYPLPNANAHGDRIFFGEALSTLDYKDRAPNRAAGFVVPSKGGERSAAAARLQELLTEQDDAENSGLLRLFTGTFDCVTCGKTSGL